jgi:hypothetical protein
VAAEDVGVEQALEGTAREYGVVGIQHYKIRLQPRRDVADGLCECLRTARERRRIQERPDRRNRVAR